MDLKLEPLSQPAALKADQQPAASHITTCPKCKYQRRAADTAPAWQCPGCGVAYAKVVPTSAAPPSGMARRARTVLDDDDEAPAVAERSPLGTVRWVVGLLLLAMVLGAGWSWVSKGNAKKLQAEQAVAAERQQAIDQAAGNLATDARLKEAADTLRSGRAREALQMVKPLAEQGNARAMLMLGMLLYSGYGGVPKDPEQAQQWLQKSANSGHTMAWVWLGYMAEFRTTETGHLEAAANYYSKAAQAGSAAGLYSLARSIDFGLGFAADPTRAYSLYALAAKAFNEQVHTNEQAPNDRSGLGSAAAMQRLKVQVNPADVMRAEELAKTWQPGQPLP